MSLPTLSPPTPLNSLSLSRSLSISLSALSLSLFSLSLSLSPFSRRGRSRQLPGQVVDLGPAPLELLAHRLHARLGISSRRRRRRALRAVAPAVLGHGSPQLVRDLHRAEFGPAHRAKVRGFRGLLRQGRVVVGASGHRIQGKVELVAPAELEARGRQGVVPDLRARVPLRQVGGVRGDLVRDDALLDVVAVGQAQVFLGRDVAKERRAGGADRGCSDRRGDVVVPGGDVRRERALKVG